MAAVDRIAGLTGSVGFKAPCRVATTAAITLSGEQTIDGVAIVSGDRVLVKNQSTTSANGIYNASTGAWSRALDFDGARDVVNGTLVYVTNGTANGGDVFALSATNPVTIDTTSLSFTSVLSLTSASAYIQTLLDDTDAATARTTLGLGTVSTLNAIASSNITDATIVNADISASAAIALSKLATITAQSVLGNATGSSAVPTAIALSSSQLLGASATGTVGAITLGSGLSMSSSTLNVTAQGTIVGRAYAEYTSNADLSTTVPIDDTVCTSAEGTQIISVSYTPASVTNRLRLRFVGNVASSTTAITAVASIFADGTNIAVGATGITSSTVPFTIETVKEYVPGTTSAITFTVRVGSSATIRMNGTSAARLFGGNLISALTIDEISA